MESEPFFPLCGFLVPALFVPTMEYSVLENAMVAIHYGLRCPVSVLRHPATRALH